MGESDLIYRMEKILRNQNITYRLNEGKVINTLGVSLTCHCSHNWESSIKNVLAGFGCTKCKNIKAGHKRRSSFLKMKNILKEKNATLLSEIETATSKDRVTIVCHYGHEWSARVEQITRGKWCKTCHENSKNLFYEPNTILRQAKEWVEVITKLNKKNYSCDDERRQLESYFFYLKPTMKSAQKTIHSITRDDEILNKTLELIHEHRARKLFSDFVNRETTVSMLERLCHLRTEHRIDKLKEKELKITEMNLKDRRQELVEKISALNISPEDKEELLLLENKSSGYFLYKDLELDLVNHIVRRRGEVFKLTKNEFLILYSALIHRSDKTDLTRYIANSSIHVHRASLQKKFSYCKDYFQLQKGTREYVLTS